MTLIAKGITTITSRLRGAPGRPPGSVTPMETDAPATCPMPLAGMMERPDPQKIGYLGAMEIFQDLGMSDMDWLESVTTMITARKGQVVYMPGETGEVLFLLKKGRVQIYRLSADGQKLVIGMLEANTFFGEMSLLGQGMYDTFAETIEDATICAMSRRDVEELITRKPQVAVRILNVVGQRLIAAESLLEDLAFRSVPARLASILLRLAEHRGNPTVHLTHQELAEMAGTYRETATLYLNQFKANGLIDLRRRQIAILDSAKLRRVVQP